MPPDDYTYYHSLISAYDKGGQWQKAEGAVGGRGAARYDARCNASPYCTPTCTRPHGRPLIITHVIVRVCRTTYPP